MNGGRVAAVGGKTLHRTFVMIAESASVWNMVAGIMQVLMHVAICVYSGAGTTRLILVYSIRYMTWVSGLECRCYDLPDLRQCISNLTFFRSLSWKQSWCNGCAWAVPRPVRFFRLRLIYRMQWELIRPMKWESNILSYAGMYSLVCGMRGDSGIMLDINCRQRFEWFW